MTFHAYRYSKLDSILQHTGIVRAGKSDHIQVVGLLHVLNPLVCLTLWVNHQWVSTSISGRVCVCITIICFDTMRSDTWNTPSAVIEPTSSIVWQSTHIISKWSASLCKWQSNLEAAFKALPSAINFIKKYYDATQLPAVQHSTITCFTESWIYSCFIIRMWDKIIV